MRKTYLLLSTFFCFLASGILMQSCIEQKQKPQAEITSSVIDTTVYLKSDVKSSPSCKIHIEYMYLTPASAEDSLSMLINSEIQKNLFEGKYIGVAPESVSTQMADNYIRSYRTDVLKLYEADVYNGMDEQDIPGWYNYEYDIQANLENGRDSIWNYTVTTFESTGGAHPNTYSKWLNIDAVSGKVLTAEDAFKKEAEKKICDLILQALIEEVNTRMKTDTIRTIEDLRSIGILLESDPYIPENFLLGKDGVSFLYNRYEIAPYASGDFKLTIPYNEIETYLNK